MAASGMNPMFLGGGAGAAHAAAAAAAGAGGRDPQHSPKGYKDSARLHELMKSSSGGGGASNKRERVGTDPEMGENYAKAAKLSRQYL